MRIQCHGINRFKHYLANLVLIWTAITVYRILPYYKNFLRSETQITILILASSYTLIAFFYYLFIPLKKIKDSKGIIIFRLLKRILKKIIFSTTSKNNSFLPIVESQEKNKLLFSIVKFFFLPLMLNFFFSNFSSVRNQLPDLASAGNLFSISTFNLILFPFILAIIFSIDTLWFSFGYAFESKLLKNKLVSVEPTLLGWTVALATYPPFNGFLERIIGWHANEYVLFSSNTLMFTTRAIITLFMLIYVWATLALGTKCSNLTNRGIVSRGPYAIVRHPAYISKNIAWWITIIPMLSLTAILSMSVWSFIYHLRTVTEENHLGNDPNYKKYCKKVKYRYVPFIY
jgi:protein-S-isoprenylcysteine O-methyltransferase Ste14